MNNINKYLCTTDMISDLKKLTGFDVDEPIPDDELDQIELVDPLEDLEVPE